ncbi:MAG TPA: hypothetical protein VMB75_02865 [Rhodocyclaceae bacterium]|nr:hypothetical protein [Rhodocyclaceae bacterium]
MAIMLLALPAAADEIALVCYNYGCATEELVVFTEERLAWARDLLAAAGSAAVERNYLALVIGNFYGWAGEQTPIKADRGGNYADDGRAGSMDCIDHSTTTTRFLRLLESRGYLRFHRVLEPAVRHRALFFGQHFTAVIEELRDIEGERRYAVDSWFVDNGQPAVILPLDDWQEGGGPDVR